MKKLMIAAAIAGAVGIAQADFSPSPFEGFENAILGTQIDISQGSPYYWNASGNDTNENYEVIETVVTNYAGTGETPLTDAGANYLALTGVELLERYVLPQQTLETEVAYDLEGGELYVDTLVKFTVTEDDAPTPAAGDKLCIWVGVVSNEATGAITTNLMVTAGYIEDDTGTTTATNYIVGAFGEAGTLGDINDWHRLTVVAYAGVDEDEWLASGFAIKVDGNLVGTEVCPFVDASTYVFNNSVAAYMASSPYKFFPSLVPAGDDGATTVTSVGFKGSGAIDNLQFTNTDPNPQQTGPTVDGTEPADGTAFVAAATSGTTNILPLDWTLDGNAIKDGNGDTYATIPSFYTAELNNGTLTLTLNTTALPTIGEATVESETKEAIEVGDTTFTATLTTTSTKLYYGLKVATSLDANATWTLGTPTQGTGSAMQISADKPSDGNGGYAAAGFYKVYVTDIAPVTP